MIETVGWMLIICGAAMLIAAAIYWCIMRINAQDEIRMQERRRLLGGYPYQAPSQDKRWDETP